MRRHSALHAVTLVWVTLAVTCSPLDTAASGRCALSHNGSTVDMVFACDPFRSPRDVLFMRSGLPPGAAVTATFQMRDVLLVSSVPGGSLGGDIVEFQGQVRVALTGTGLLAGFNRLILLNATGRFETGPRVGANVQGYDMNILDLFANTIGDPDFTTLEMRAGSAFALPSPGHTEQWWRVPGDWAVDSFFDVQYQIDFVGAPGSILDGFSGSQTSGARFGTGGPPRSPCAAPDVAGTSDVPPPCVDTYKSSWELPVLRSGLPDGSVVTGTMRMLNVSIGAEVAGGNFGGDEQTWTADVEFELLGHGDLFGWSRTVTVPVNGQTRSGPRGAGALQGFPVEIKQMTGQIVGDPDFDLFRIDSGTDLGFISPGHTNLTQLGSGDWFVDSFFDVTFRITWQGALGGALSGMSGGTGGQAHLDEGQPLEQGNCVAADIQGTAQMPADCSLGYRGTEEGLMAVNGLPAGSPLLTDFTLENFVVVEGPGGSLGGDMQTWTADLELNISGVGVLSGFARTLTIPVTGETHSGDRQAGMTTQSFPTDLVDLQGTVVGDPDFSSLSITAGSTNGFKSDGRTVFSQSVPNWIVDSFFDIHYKIEFTGDPGGSLAGTSGSTLGAVRLTAGSKEVVSVPSPSSLFRVGLARPNPTRKASTVEFVLPNATHVRIGVHDISGRRVAEIANAGMPAGRHVARWNGVADDGRTMPAGMYFFTLRIGSDQVERRVALLR